MPSRSRTPSPKRILKIPVISAKITETTDARVIACPITPTLTPNVFDISCRKRAVKIAIVPVAKLANIKEEMNNLLAEATFSPWFKTLLHHHAKKHTDTKSN
jgi:hypothetical protein